MKKPKQRETPRHVEPAPATVRPLSTKQLAKVVGGEVQFNSWDQIVDGGG